MDILKIKTPKRKLGSFGEKIARRYLRRHGYRIKAKNFVADDHEIDLIAEDKSTLVFVEVKTRNVKSLGKIEMRPASSVTPEKQRKIINRFIIAYKRRNTSLLFSQWYIFSQYKKELASKPFLLYNVSKINFSKRKIL